MVDPDHPFIGAPTVAFGAGRPATLSLQADSAARIQITVMPFTIVGGARDRSNAAWCRSSVLVLIDGKISAAAAIYPNPSAVKAPAIALVARRTTALV